MKYPKTSEAIVAFFNSNAIQSSHNSPELLSRYTADMEVQINVAVDGGIPVEGKRNTWRNEHAPDAEPWFHIRNPKNAKDVPERRDWLLKFDLAEHVEGIGLTGWDFGCCCSRWFGFDFDSIVGHAEGVGNSDAELEAVRRAAMDIPWLEIRKSTGGGGLHLYAICCEEGIPTSNHTEHAALGRAILEKMAIAANFNFSKNVDVCGGNMWIWHRKSTQQNGGLKLLKEAFTKLSLNDIPGNWRSHLTVAEGKRATQRVIGIPEDAQDKFDQLIFGCRHVPFDSEHKRIIESLGTEGFTMIYQQDNHLVQAHTARIVTIANDTNFNIRGTFKTLSEGKNPGAPNCFMFPLVGGGWKVYRFTPGTKESSTWDQSGYWTHCKFNVALTLDEAALAFDGYEMSDGTYCFNRTELGLQALTSIGVELRAPSFTKERAMSVAYQNRSGRKIVVSIAREDGDENARVQADMKNDGWHFEGKREQSKKWVKVLTLPPAQYDLLDESSDRFESLIRSMKVADGVDAGWRLLDADGVWVGRDRTAATDMLAGLGVSSKDSKPMVARIQHRNWTMQNLPFQPEFPGGRVWNIGAQLAFEATKEDRDLYHPHWDMILKQIGQGLDAAVRLDSWCLDNGVADGATYLLYWCASLFQRPSQKLPYLFIFGPEETGKSTLHRALGLLMSKGHVEARNALLTEYNAELDGAILAYIEEVNLSGKNGDVFSRLKDFVTADKITIHAKYANPYQSVSHLHWIQVSNHQEYCPIFPSDSRIVVIHAAEKLEQDLRWEDQLKPALKAQSPDFLRTLFDIRLPDGIGRLWLPVLSTEAKREAAARRESGPGYVAVALEAALRLRVIIAGGTYTGLISKLCKEVGEGPWSDDPGQFGKQLRGISSTGIERGLSIIIKDTARGSVVTIEELWDENNTDPFEVYAHEVLSANFAVDEADAAQTAAAMNSYRDSEGAS